MAGVVIVGASAAGLAVAETMRREGFAGRVSLIGEEHKLPYDRPPLSKQVLAGPWPAERAMLREPDAIDALDLDLRLGVRATSLDAQARVVHVDDGDALAYDDLVVATGVRPRTLPRTPNLDGVYVLRTLADAQRLRLALKPGSRLVIVGAGFLGAEVAATARGLGVDVTLVSDIPAPLADVVGTEIGELLREVHVERGVTLLAGVGVEDVTVDGGRATGVRLADGRELAADAIVVAIGCVPNVDWLRSSGVPLADGVRCDAFCRAAPGVWAAGDVASWEHPTLGRLRIEHRTNAGEQGMAVARNVLAGADAIPFAPVPYVWTDQYDLKLQIYGLPAGSTRMAVVEGALTERRFVALCGDDRGVRAAIGLNAARALRSVRPLVADRAAWDSVTTKQPAGANV